MFICHGVYIMEKKKITDAQLRATAKYQNKAYFKTLVRFKKADEDIIRTASGESLNGFIVCAVMEKIQRDFPELITGESEV